MYEWNSEHFHFQTVFISICVRSMRKFMLVRNFVGLNWIRCNRITNRKNWKKWKEREICLESRHFQIVRFEFILSNFSYATDEGKEEEEIETCIRILTDRKFVFSSSFHLEAEKKVFIFILCCASLLFCCACEWSSFSSNSSYFSNVMPRRYSAVFGQKTLAYDRLFGREMEWRK